MAKSDPSGLGRSEAASGLMLISPTAIYAVLLLAAPLATVLLYSVLAGAHGAITWDFTLANYIEVWTGPVYRAIMVRSLIVSVGVTIVTVVVAYPIAYFVSFHVHSSRKSLWLFLITIPFWTSYLIRVFLWKVILGYNGVINSGLMSTGIISEPLQWINYNVGALIVTLAHAYAPFAILPIFVSLEKIDRSLLEAGQDLGESRLRTFWRVTLPLSMAGVVAATLIVFIPTVGDYVTPDLIGGGKLPMIANMMEVQMLKVNNKPLGSAIAVSAMFIVALVAIGFVFANRRFLGGAEMKAPGLRAYAIGYLIFLYAPIVLLPVFAFNDSRVIAFPLSGFTTHWFSEMWGDSQLFLALKNSMIISGSTAVTATTLGIFAARATTRFSFPAKGGLLGLIMLPLVLPEMIVAMSLLVVLLAIGVKLSFLTVILGHVLICTPFAVAILSSAFQSLDKSLEEAAYDLGETPFSTFRLIILPLVMPGVISSLLICFTISLDEFIIAYFLAGADTVLSSYIYGQFRFPARVPAMLALGTILVLVSITLLSIAEYFRRRGLAKTGGKDTGGFL